MIFKIDESLRHEGVVLVTCVASNRLFKEQQFDLSWTVERIIAFLEEDLETTIEIIPRKFPEGTVLTADGVTLLRTAV